MTTEAQLYLNEQTTERRFTEELAAQALEIAVLREENERLKSAGHKQGKQIADSVEIEIASLQEAWKIVEPHLPPVVYRRALAALKPGP